MSFAIASILFWIGAFTLVVVVRDESRLAARLVWFALILASIVAACLRARSAV